jgi:hypothetical protein
LPEDPSIAKQTYIQLDWLIGQIAKNRTRDIPIIIVVDCCRTEIANDQSHHGDPIKTTVEQPNVFIMYATPNGRAAKDGMEGRNGIFTERLLKYLDADMTIVEISNKITKDLKGKQVRALPLLNQNSVRYCYAYLFTLCDYHQTHWISLNMDDHYRFRQLSKEHVSF